jgi:nicotinamidase-related amidase
MTTLTERPRTALLVIDVQNGVMAGAHNRAAVIANVSSLVDRARAERVPVVWVQHSNDEMPVGGESWRYVAELVPGDAEPVVAKRYSDSFEDTDLEAVLAERGVGRLVVTGAQTDTCVRCTLHGAIVRGYDVTLVGDAHTTEDLTEWGAPAPEKVIDHENLFWRYHSAPGRSAGTVPTGEVTFG